MPDFLTTLAGKVIAGLVGVILIFALFTYFQWGKGEQPKQDARSANAAAETAKEAAATAIERSSKDADIDKLVENTAKLIDTLPPEEAGKEARKAICALPAYAKDKSCAK